MRFKSLEEIAHSFGLVPPGQKPTAGGQYTLLDKLEITSENWHRLELQAHDEQARSAHQKAVYSITDFNTAEEEDRQKAAALNTRLRNRANSKNLTHTLAAALMQLPSAHNPKAYANTFLCASYVVKEGDRYKSKYCHNRWCLVCNRIKTAYYINLYEPHLKAWKDKQFVTLTAPCVKKERLQDEIAEYLAAFVRIKDRLRKRGIKLKGIRKLEITYNPRKNWYHPHLHLVIEGENHANLLHDLWLEEFKNANEAAQKVVKADENSLKEMFKYFTKITSDNKDEPTITLPALDAIFAAVKGRRVFQSFGFKTRKIEQPTDEEMDFWRDVLRRNIEAERQTSPKVQAMQPESQLFTWNHEAGNYLQYGEPLTDYQGADAARDFAKRLIFEENRLVYESNTRKCKFGRHNRGHAHSDSRFNDIRAAIRQGLPEPERYFLPIESSDQV